MAYSGAIRHHYPEENEMEKYEQLLQLRDEFRDGPYAAKWQAMELFRRWAVLTGDYSTADASVRFMDFVELESP